MAWEASLVFYGVNEAERELLRLAFTAIPDLLVEAVTELGLFMEREVKLRTPVDYGRLRASIGHYTPQDIRRPSADPAHQSIEADSYWAVMVKRGRFEAHVGTNVEYAPYLEYGYSWPRDGQPRVVYLEYVKGRRVDGFRVLKPRTYPPQRMFELGVRAAQAMIPVVVTSKLKRAGFSV